MTRLSIYDFMLRKLSASVAVHIGMVKFSKDLTLVRKTILSFLTIVLFSLPALSSCTSQQAVNENTNDLFVRDSRILNHRVKRPIEKVAHLLEVSFNRQASKSYELIITGFVKSSRLGYWKRWVKPRDSIAREIRNHGPEGGGVMSFTDAKALVGDGIGMRLVLDHPAAEVMNRVTAELVEMIRQKKVTVIRIENYSGPDAPPYLSEGNIARVVQVGKTQEVPPQLLPAKEAERSSGYTTAHFDLMTNAGAKVELQVRGVLLEQLDQIQQIYYDWKTHKPVSSRWQNNSKVIEMRSIFATMTLPQRRDYESYLENGFTFVREFETQGSSFTAPRLPQSIRRYDLLRVEVIADFLDSSKTGYRRIRDLYTDPTGYSPLRSKYQFFDSVRHVMQSDRISDEQRRDLLGNVANSADTRYRMQEISPEISKLRKKMKYRHVDGTAKELNYVEIIASEENVFLKDRRYTIRAFNKGRDDKRWIVDVALQAYDESQELGPATVKIHEINLMQAGAKFRHDNYFVVDNAIAIARGELDYEKWFGRLHVWRDVNGQIWTTDHRRYIAYVLSGTVHDIEIEFVSYDYVKKSSFKYSNSDEGKSILLRWVDEDNPAREALAVIVRVPEN